MRKVAVGLCAVGLMNGWAMGGTVVFSPGAQDVTLNSGATVSMDLSVHVDGSHAPTISGADIVIGSNDVPFNFSYNSAWTTAMPNLTAPISGVGSYTHDLLVGGSNPTAGAGTSVPLGTVTVNTTGLALGTYQILVDSGIDQGFSSVFAGFPGQPFVSEPLTGAGSFSVVAIPEPATLSLLGLGLLGFLRRRRAA